MFRPRGRHLRYSEIATMSSRCLSPIHIWPLDASNLFLFRSRSSRYTLTSPYASVYAGVHDGTKPRFWKSFPPNTNYTDASSTYSSMKCMSADSEGNTQLAEEIKLHEREDMGVIANTGTCLFCVNYLTCTRSF